MRGKSRFGADGAGRGSSGNCECRCKSEDAGHTESARNNIRKDERGREQHANATERGWHPLSCAYRDAANECEYEPAKQATVQSIGHGAKFSGDQSRTEFDG